MDLGYLRALEAILDPKTAENRPARVLSTAAFVARLRLFTLGHRLVRGVVGRLFPRDAARVEANLRRLLGLAPVQGRP
ncbi:hypothetical protein [Thermus caliditerrae]|uniref:hypothetical protein n=1 Tax=Thermus caliditerrae TaxID=1330700 RepID=UPI001F1694AF|nr:hypothetical protein [Thermus caliditerrae]